MKQLQLTGKSLGFMEWRWSAAPRGIIVCPAFQEMRLPNHRAIGRAAINQRTMSRLTVSNLPTTAACVLTAALAIGQDDQAQKQGLAPPGETSPAALHSRVEAIKAQGAQVISRQMRAELERRLQEASRLAAAGEFDKAGRLLSLIESDQQMAY
jgi:hypothetical protein